MRKQAVQDNITGYIFIFPWLIGLVIFTAFPMIWSIYLSLTDYNLMSKANFIGLENYKRAFTSDVFANSLKVSGTYAIFQVPIHLVIALAAAMALNRSLKGVGIYRTLFYMPVFIGGSVGVNIMWRMLFSETGFVNSVITSMGLQTVQFFNSVKNALPTLIGTSMWVLGGQMLIFLAGLQNVPDELYEAAKMDGANSIKCFRHITIPSLSPVLLYNLTMALIGALQVFTSAFVITKGGPAQSTYFYCLYLYDEAFKYFRMGYASALAWILFVIILALTLILFKVTGQSVFYASRATVRREAK